MIAWEPGRQELVMVAIGGFVCLFTLTCFVWQSVLERQNPLRRRINQIIGAKPRKDEALANDRTGPIMGLVLRLLNVKPEDGARGARLLSHKAGLVAVAALAALACGGMMGYVAVAVQLPVGLVLPGMIIAMWGGAVMAAKFWLGWHARRWVDQINDNLIDVLDLWVLCLSAGMGFQNALVRVLKETVVARNALREELQITHQEILAGCPRDEAMRHLADRNHECVELRALVSQIIQSERLGSSLAQVLKIYSGSLRFKRRQDAEEMIHKMPVKMAFPLVFFIMPALFIVILGPSVLRMFTFFGE